MTDKAQTQQSKMQALDLKEMTIQADSPPRRLSPAAERALAEAAERRKALDAQAAALGQKAEIKGRGGLDPVRYTDWEIKGIASDF